MRAGTERHVLRCGILFASPFCVTHRLYVLARQANTRAEVLRKLTEYVHSHYAATNQKQARSYRQAVIRFAGDSGDGMQITGSQFTNTVALYGNDIRTFPGLPCGNSRPCGNVARRKWISTAFFLR